MAREKNAHWVELASSFAVKMLPQIFRAGDPVLEVAFPPETHKELEELLESLPTEVFAADDSLGWVYQFWQTEEKKRVNASEVPIGADELPAVTQLFTEDYMVLFLLHNTLGAWWTAKRKSEGKDPNLPGYEWTYLRLRDDGMPSAGAFEGWPKLARDIKVLDPSMGSGHFLTFALPILVGIRVEEEGLTREEAVEAVLRDNLFGLEIDNRCTQIAAFNLALTAWRMVGHRPLPQLNVACSGLGVNAKVEEWVALAGDNERLCNAMEKLYSFFRNAPALGSLIDPVRVGGKLFMATFREVSPLLQIALSTEESDKSDRELAVVAQGVIQAARMLANTFTLVTTNVPYLGSRKQEDVLKEYCESNHPDAKSDLATCFVDRCYHSAELGGTVALVTPQSWLYAPSYRSLRKRLLTRYAFSTVARLGPHAFETIGGEVVSVALVVSNSLEPSRRSEIAILNATAGSDPQAKANLLLSAPLKHENQTEQLGKPGCKIGLGAAVQGTLLSQYVENPQGIKSGDDFKWIRSFWELPVVEGTGWELCQTAVGDTGEYGGLGLVVDWRTRGEGMVRPRKDCVALGRMGVCINQTSNLFASLYLGGRFDSTVTPLVPYSPEHLSAVWAFCSSSEFQDAVREGSPALFNTNSAILEVEFDLDTWTEVALERYSEGLPAPDSNNPTEGLFSGLPDRSSVALQVAIPRLLGYRWPRQTGSKITGCPAPPLDSLGVHADPDGIVPLIAIKGETTAGDRVRALLSDTYGGDWSAAKLAELLSQVDYAGKKLEDWLRDGFFDQHCELFRQRPFVLHIWDGLKDGFGALVNYHKLAGPNGEGRRTLEKLIYTYLGDWIDRQRADQKNGVEGSDAKLAAAEHLQKELEKILKGKPPYDIFVRWKPLTEQPIGWEPDINDGVRLNIRPFMTAKVLNGRGKSTCVLRSTPKIKWDKDRGKEPHRPKEEFPWFWSWDGSTEDFTGEREFDGNRWNDLHYSIQKKLEARERHKGKKK